MTPEEFWAQFKDARKSAPEEGEVLAIFRAMAEFVDSPEKRNYINLVTTEDKAEAAVEVMQKLHCAHPLDAIRIPLRIARDLMAGWSVEEVAKFPYPFQTEMYFFAKPEVVPADDKHWTVVPLEFAKPKDAAPDAECSEPIPTE
jgi:hypothetical protein